MLVLNNGRIRVLEVLFSPRISAWGREASQAEARCSMVYCKTGTR